MSPFIKFEEDIIRAYQTIHGNFENITDSLFLELNKTLTPFLNEMINSYYFEGDFKATYHYDEDSETTTIQYHTDENCEPFLDLGYLKYDDKDPVKYDIKIDTEKLIAALKEIDPLYNLIYEDSAVKRKLNLVNKKEVDFMTIQTTSENIYEVFSKLHGIGHYEKNWNKHQKYQIESTLQDNLKTLNKLSFVNFDNNINRTFIIAYNKNQVAGLSCIATYSHFDDYEKENKDQYYARKYMAYSSYIAVASQFRGNGLGLELMKKTIEYANENKMILLRSSSTSEGHSYMKENIDNIVLKTKDVVIVNASDEGFFSEFSKIITNIKNEKEYDDFYEKVKPTIAKISEISINYDRVSELYGDDYEKKMEFRLQGLEVVDKVIKDFKDSYVTPIVNNTRKIKNHV
jgi:GNAT superfamily N-acetyltransferase